MFFLRCFFFFKLHFWLIFIVMADRRRHLPWCCFVPSSLGELRSFEQNPIIFPVPQGWDWAPECILHSSQATTLQGTLRCLGVKGCKRVTLRDAASSVRLQWWQEYCLVFFPHTFASQQFSLEAMYSAVSMPRFNVSCKHETDSLALCPFSELYYLLLDSSEAWHDSSQRIQRKILSEGGWEQRA